MRSGGRVEFVGYPRAAAVEVAAALGLCLPFREAAAGFAFDRPLSLSLPL